MANKKSRSSRNKKSTLTIKRYKKKNVSEVYIKYSLMGLVVILAAAAGLLTSTNHSDAVKDFISATVSALESAGLAVADFIKSLLF